MRKDILAAVLAVSAFGAGVQTASAEGFYAGAGIGQSTAKINGGFKDDDIGFKIFGGYGFNQNLAVEIEYLDGGTAKDEGFDLETTGFGVSALGSLPLSDAFSLFARLGYGSWEAKLKDDFGNSAKDDDEELFYGLGAGFNVTPQFQVRLEWEGVDVSGGSFNTIGVNGVFKFGSLN